MNNEHIYKKLVYILLFMVCFSSMSSEETYYEILGVKSTAEKSEIVRAYRKLASKYHPDRYSDSHQKVQAVEKMADINTAYTVLKDQEMREEYDRVLTVDDIINKSLSPDQKRRNNLKKGEFYSAFASATDNSTSAVRKAVAFEKIAQMGLELNNRQVHSILHIVVRVGQEYEFVRLAAIRALSQYVNQLFIDDIELLLLLGSDKNKIDDRDLKKGQSKTKSRFIPTFRSRSSTGQEIVNRSDNTQMIISNKDESSEKVTSELGIKKRALGIADQWFQSHFTANIDQILEVIVNSNNEYKDNYDYFREYALKALEESVYIEQLSPEHILLLKDYAKKSGFKVKKKIKGILKKWDQRKEGVGTAIETYSEQRNLVRFSEETIEQEKDSVLYGIKGMGEGINYLKDNPKLPSKKVQEIVDYLASYISTFQEGLNLISYLSKNFPKHDMTEVLNTMIYYTEGMASAHDLIKNYGKYFSQQHFIQILSQTIPFYFARRGIAHGSRILSLIWEYVQDDESRVQIVHILKHLPVRTAEDGEKFISLAENYLSEEDRRRIRNQNHSLGNDSSGKACARQLKKLKR